MLLDKWYADAVVDDRLTVLYRARLHLGPLSWGYQGCLRNGSAREGRFSWNRPRDGLPRLSAQDRQLVLATASGPAFWQYDNSRAFELWSDGRQRVVWEPVVRNGDVSGSLCGRGYAERLTLDIMPWKLGLRQLWWGRFCGARHSLIWIIWEGRIPRRLAVVDGEELADVTATEHCILAGDSRLDIVDAELVADAPLGSGALARMPWPKKLAPAHFLGGQEVKWFGQGILARSGAVVDRGSVVHERVDWS